MATADALPDVEFATGNGWRRNGLNNQQRGRREEDGNSDPEQSPPYFFRVVVIVGVAPDTQLIEYFTVSQRKINFDEALNDSRAKLSGDDMRLVETLQCTHVRLRLAYFGDVAARTVAVRVAL